MLLVSVSEYYYFGKYFLEYFPDMRDENPFLMRVRCNVSLHEASSYRYEVNLKL